MAVWCEDFATFSLEEILKYQNENRAWSKELRRRNATLVNNRLAKLTSQDDYIANRNLVHEATAECRRRASILDSQITRRMIASPVREA